MLGVAVLQSGLALMAAGVVVAIVSVTTTGWPWPPGPVVTAFGLVVAAVGALLPVPSKAAPARRAIIDDYAPAWQFEERHSRRMAAPPERVYAATRTVRAGDIRFFHFLTWLRRLGRSRPPDILHAPSDQPIVDTAVAGGFVLLADAAPRELAVGELAVGAVVLGGERLPRPLTPEQFGAIVGPGFAKATMNFVVASDGAGGSIVTTETRVHATDPRSARRFAMYWRIIQPGSGLIRRMWLRAIQVRAEEGSTS